MIRMVLLLVMLLSTLASGGGSGRGGGLACPKGFIGGGLTPCIPAYSDFEFAPTSGAGMGSPCTGTMPTGAKGEAMTFARASSATCLRSSTTSISNGDLVVLGADIPRVMPGGNGTGSLGVFLERGTTNLIQRSEEINNAVWVTAGTITITPNYSIDPAQGSSISTAERVQCAATGIGEYSEVYQTFTGTNAGLTCSGFIRGTSSSGSIDACLYAGAWVCSTCAYSPSSWSRCDPYTGSTTAGIQYCIFGNMTHVNGGIVRPYNDFLLWGVQGENGPLTSYVPTAGATSARVDDSPLTSTSTVAIGPSFSMASTALATSTTTPSSLLVQIGSAAPNIASITRATDTGLSLLVNVTTTTPAVASLGTTSHRYSLQDALGVRTAALDGVAVAAPADSMAATETVVTIGSATGIVLKQVCIGAPGRCQ